VHQSNEHRINLPLLNNERRRNHQARNATHQDFTLSTISEVLE
jgi:hypothetical protein